MREKKLWLVISFETNTAAMAAEALCKQEGIGGRIIPLPKEISAGCGLSWRAEVTERPKLEALLRREQITPGGIYEIVL